MTKKNLAALNVKIDPELSDLLGKVSDITGKTKSSLVEEAIRSIVSPYCEYEYTEEGEVKRHINAKLGFYQDPDNPTGLVECYILADTTIYGNPYKKIYKDGQLMQVPANKITDM